MERIFFIYRIWKLEFSLFLELFTISEAEQQNWVDGLTQDQYPSREHPAAFMQKNEQVFLKKLLGWAKFPHKPMQLDICLTFLYHCKQKYIQMAHIQGETVCKTAITFMYNYENFQTFIHLPFKQKIPIQYLCHRVLILLQSESPTSFFT